MRAAFFLEASHCLLKRSFALRAQDFACRLPFGVASLTPAKRLNLAGRAGFEPAHGVINSHVPFQLGYRPKDISKKRKAPTFVGASEIKSELGKLTH